MYNRHHAIGGYCSVNLDYYSIPGLTTEFFNLQVLLQPLEEQFYLPSVVIKVCIHQRADVQSIGKEYESLSWLRVKVDDSSDLLRILASGQLSVHIPDGIGQDTGRHPAFPPHRSEVVVLSAPEHEVWSDTVYGEEPSEVIVGAVEDVERVLLEWDDIHRFRIVQPGRRDMEESRYLGLNIILDSAFLLPEQSPLKYAEAQVNRGGVKGIHLSFELEYLDCPALLGFCHSTIVWQR